MVLGKIISSKGYTFGQKWIISMIFRSFFITCIHKYGPNSPCASKMILIFTIFYYLYGIFWYCEVRSVGSLTLIKSRFGHGVVYYGYLLIHGFNWKFRWNGSQTLLPSPPIFQLMIMYDGMGCPNLIDGWKSFASSWEEIPIDLSIASSTRKNLCNLRKPLL